MTNEELIERIKTIFAMPNEADVMIELKKFKKEYKKSKFYKMTHKPFWCFIRQYKMLNPINMDHLFVRLQDYIDNLDLEHLEELMNNFGDKIDSTVKGNLGELKDLDLSWLKDFQ